jgi:ankyrin repeat protein
MKNIILSTIAVVVMLVCGDTELVQAAKPQPYKIDIWTATAQGNLEAIQQHSATGADLNAKEPAGGSTPLIIASVYGQTAAAQLLIENGTPVNIKNNDGATALHTAAFFGHTDAVKFLLKKGAAINAQNVRRETPLDTVAAPWSPELEGLYQYIGEALQIPLNMEKIKTARPQIASLLRKQGGKKGSELKKDTVPAIPFKGSYYMNGEIHVNTYGTPEGRPLTKDHQDFKPSWSKTGDMLVFFRRLKNHRVTVNWKTAICIINVDGTGFHQLTDGTHTDFNQTWTRDGSNTPIWNRKNPETGSFYVMQSKVGAKPGQEVALTDKSFHTWAYTCLKDGRILVQSAHPKQIWGYFLMTPKVGEEPKYEHIDCELAKKGLLDRVSVSPSEKKVCFEYQKGFKYKDAGRTLYIADFDAKKRTITNARPFANEEGANRWFAYPRWTRDETAIVYHASPSLYLYTLKDGSTRKVSTNDGADYRYPHCEATPK